MRVDADDGVGGVGDDRGQLFGRLFAAPQFRLVQGALFAAKGGEPNRRGRAAPRLGRKAQN